MAKCSKCEHEGYEHVIDLQGQNYGWLNDDEMPIYKTILNDKDLLCETCADNLADKHGGQFVRDFLYGKTNSILN